MLKIETKKQFDKVVMLYAVEVIKRKLAAPSSDIKDHVLDLTDHSIYLLDEDHTLRILLHARQHRWYHVGKLTYGETGSDIIFKAAHGTLYDIIDHAARGLWLSLCLQVSGLIHESPELDGDGKALVKAARKHKLPSYLNDNHASFINWFGVSEKARSGSLG